MLRRSFLKDAGILTILVASGEVWRAFGQSAPEIANGAAFEPWRNWSQETKEGLPGLVHAAILCSNAFNSQPWLFQVKDSFISIFADTHRNLGAFDPYLREMYLSLGCALENLLLAAAHHGYSASPKLAPGTLALESVKPSPVLVASIELSHGKKKTNELYEAIPHRHTNRSLFDKDKAVPEKFIRELNGATQHDPGVKVFLFTDETQRKSLVDIVWDASLKLLSDPEVAKGTQPWLRGTEAQLEESQDGIYVGAGGPNAKPESYTTLMSSGRLFGIIAVRDRYDCPQTLQAGRVWQRIHLLATARGLAARPANGAVEIMDHEQRLRQPAVYGPRLAQLTGDESWQPTFMFYLGYPTVSAVASVRRPAQNVMIR